MNYLYIVCAVIGGIVFYTLDLGMSTKVDTFQGISQAIQGCFAGGLVLAFLEGLFKKTTKA